MSRLRKKLYKAMGLTPRSVSSATKSDVPIAPKAPVHVKKEVLKQAPIPTTQQGLAYQEKVAVALDARWEMISRELPIDGGSLLDIGSNLGDFTARAAQQGLWSIGVELDPKLARKAQSRYADIVNCGFMAGSFGPKSVANIPTFDAMLILSVHHNWHHVFGAEATAEMMRGLLKKTKQVMIFEGASRNERYLSSPPGFTDNDESSVTSYYSEYLASIAGPHAKITLLGKSDCVGEREPYRWMYAIRP